MKNVFCEEYNGCIISANVYGKDLQYCVIEDLSNKKLLNGTLNAQITNIVFLRNKLKNFVDTRNSNFEIKELEVYR